jgi:pyruvate ferredoxin oxidoreductase alpha subunit
MILGLSGNNTTAYAMRQINPDVVAAYPITPQTQSMEKFAEYVADGIVDTEFILVESEHSAMSACIGASAAGARVMTATASQGLAYMWELLPIASAMRLPIVMSVMNRALSGPINIHCDHSDTMGARDSGWIQIFAENVQEVYDNTLQAVRIAEEARLPAMCLQDGFIISHCMERVETLKDKIVTDFLGEYQPLYPLLDVENPVVYGAFDMPDHCFEHRLQVEHAMKKALDVIKKINQEYGELAGRYHQVIEPYLLDDAELAIVAAGSTIGTTRAAINRLRREGIKAGLLEIRCFRPFPHDEVYKALRHIPRVAVLDRSLSPGAMGGPIFMEIRNAMHACFTHVINYIYGLGGRDITLWEIVKVFSELEQIPPTCGESTAEVYYLGMKA